MGKEYYLINGLENYNKVRDINESLIENYEINKIAFFQNKTENIEIVLKLNDQTTQDIINSYSLGAYIYMDNKYLYSQDINWNTKPTIQVLNNHKYIINTLNISQRRMDSLVFYLFDRDKYRKILGNRVVIKNIAF